MKKTGTSLGQNDKNMLVSLCESDVGRGILSSCVRLKMMTGDDPYNQQI